jgi:hypothetical protein
VLSAILVAALWVVGCGLGQGALVAIATARDVMDSVGLVAAAACCATATTTFAVVGLGWIGSHGSPSGNRVAIFSVALMVIAILVLRSQAMGFLWLLGGAVVVTTGTVAVPLTRSTRR